VIDFRFWPFAAAGRVPENGRSLRKQTFIVVESSVSRLALVRIYQILPPLPRKR